MISTNQHLENQLLDSRNQSSDFEPLSFWEPKPLEEDDLHQSIFEDILATSTNQSDQIILLEKTIEGLNQSLKTLSAKNLVLEKELILQRKTIKDLNQQLIIRPIIEPLSIEMAEAEDNQLIRQLGELFSREDKKSIQIFKGSNNDCLVTDWIREAERIARNNQWDDAQKLRFFPDRFKGEAMDWHVEYIEQHDNIDYREWKQALIERFRDEADLDNLKNKLQHLKQKSEQRTKAYVAKINNLYDTIYGKEIPISANATPEAVRLNEEIKKLRSEAKRKIFLKGLISKIKEELWPRMTRDQTFEEICQLAYTAERIVIYKELIEDKPPSLIATVNQQLESLRDEVKKLSINNVPPKQEENNIPVFVIDDHQVAVEQTRPGGKADSRNLQGIEQNNYRKPNFYQHQTVDQRGLVTNYNAPNRRYYPHQFNPPIRNSRYQNYNNPRAVNPNFRGRTNYSPPNSNLRYSQPPNYTSQIQRQRNSFFQYRNEITCNKCRNKGHFARECRTNPQKKE